MKRNPSTKVGAGFGYWHEGDGAEQGQSLRILCSVVEGCKLGAYGPGTYKSDLL